MKYHEYTCKKTVEGYITVNVGSIPTAPAIIEKIMF